ncbi:hypothetical protein, partial [Listeria monocytogenes]|uniref:hypothetical protein n=1 Tax=Listeria monocytogenes TaxID=1639 RepID=UPI002FDBC4D5
EHKHNHPESPYAKYHVGAWKRYPNYHGSLDAIVQVVRKSNLLFTDSDLQFLCMAPPNIWCKYYLEKKGLWK